MVICFTKATADGVELTKAIVYDAMFASCKVLES